MKTYFRFVHIIPLLIVTILDCVTPTPYYHTDKDGRRYLIEIEKNYNWLEAFDQCALRGMQLVVIDNLTKNSALVSLLTSVYGNAQQMWIGHHDEFGTSKAKDRPFYSAATGNKISYGFWTSGNPSNDKSNEHCVHIIDAAYRWNDMPCTKSYGYICEEHYLTTQYNANLAQRRQSTNVKNNNIISEFEYTQKKIDNVISNAENSTDNIFENYLLATEEILKGFSESLDNILRKTPSLEVVNAEVRGDIQKLEAETKQVLDKISDQTLREFTEVSSNAKVSASSENLQFATKLTTNKNEINTILT